MDDKDKTIELLASRIKQLEGQYAEVCSQLSDMTVIIHYLESKLSGKHYVN